MTSKEVGILLLNTFILVLHTVLSVYVARLDGVLVRDIVSADGKGFLRGLGWWFALAIPSTYTNSMVSVSRYENHILLTSNVQLRYLQSKLSLSLRTRLTRYTHDLYLSSAPDLKYYRVGHEGGLNGIDQCVVKSLFRDDPS